MEHTNYQKKILTIPNLLSFFRLCLIPVMIWLYTIQENYGLTTLVLLLSGITDVVDGIIARKCNMISDFGKAFDPIADKLTQVAMMFCLVTRFPWMILPLVLLVVKELSDRYGWAMGRVKWIYDMSSLVVAILLMLLLFGEFSFSMIGAGTLLLTLVNTPLITGFGKLLDRFFVFTPFFPRFHGFFQKHFD
jgi:phosphatidylglycerophosphate synthase